MRIAAGRASSDRARHAVFDHAMSRMIGGATGERSRFSRLGAFIEQMFHVKHLFLHGWRHLMSSVPS
ncbi:hypothetical protein B5F40_13935 [Gordonibacter sp. An230]|nr:hypothetical protein B5F40_13935 [Gordonibacter sp. An230]